MSQVSDALNRGPHHLDLYLLLGGLIAGLLLGPMVLGRVSPATYRTWFAAGAAEHDQVLHQRLQRLIQTGVSDVAASEMFEREQQQQVEQHLNWLRSRWLAMVLTVLVVMVVETVLPPGPACNRLSMARYVLMAVWLAVAVAQPRLIADVPLLFVCVLAVVAILAAAAPLRKFSTSRDR